MADLDLSTLKAYTPLFPMLIKKYEQFVPDQNASVLDKINSIIAELNAIGQLSNNVVKDWNTVYQWCMNDGLQTDVNNKLEDMRTNGEISDILNNIFDNLTGDMTTLHTTAKDKLVNSINEVDDLAKLNQTNIGDLTTLTTTDKGNLVAAINNNVASLAEIAINVKSYGAKGDGTSDDTTSIQNAINVSPVGSTIFFPAGTYMISSPIVILPNRTYQGTGWGSTIKQMNGKNLAQMIQFADQTSQHTNAIIKDLQLDGNKTNNTTTATAGLYLFGLLNSMLYRVRVQNCKGNGIWIDGNNTYNASTNHVVDCWAYNNTGYGIYLAGACIDAHVLGGDYGLNYNCAAYIAGSSCSIRDAVFWGSQSGTCFYISGVGNQITNCNIEGAAGHGVEVHGNHNFLIGNKIYDNANISADYGLYDGIYVNGTSGSYVENVILIGNQIWGGMTSGTSGYYRYAINLDTYHKNCECNANAVRYADTNAVFDTSHVLINGIAANDIVNGLLYSTSTTRLGNAYSGQIIFETDTLQHSMWDGTSNQWVYLLKSTSSTTANRPTGGNFSGRLHFDTTLNKPIWRNTANTGWVDATGATV
jgi:hypothetical protein